MIQALFPVWLDAGHEIRVCEGPPAAGVQADLAFLHVDASRVPDEYVDALRRFKIAWSWGGPVSLAVPYELAGIRERQQGRVLRLAIGLEDPQDLMDDLAQAWVR